MGMNSGNPPIGSDLASVLCHWVGERPMVQLGHGDGATGPRQGIGMHAAQAEMADAWGLGPWP
jgi:hypothetical protein